MCPFNIGSSLSSVENGVLRKVRTGREIVPVAIHLTTHSRLRTHWRISVKRAELYKADKRPLCQLESCKSNQDNTPAHRITIYCLALYS
jgi:hypothetical protein